MPVDRRSRVISSSSSNVEDVDAMALLAADGLRCEYVQLDSTPFRARWTVVSLDSLVAQFGSAAVAVVRRMRVPEDRWAFMVPLGVGTSARWNGHALRHDDLLVCPPRSESLAFDPAETRFAVITVSAVSRSAEAALPIGGVQGNESVAVACGPDAAALRECLTEARDCVERRAGSSASGLQVVEHVLIGCLRHAAATCGEAVTLGGRSRIVCRAEAFFRRHMREGVSVAELSSVAGVSERSLRNAFYDVYTTSPKRYMKLWQLHQVRHALRAGTYAATVTHVATDHGFYELGRFAAAYKSLFGEAPSETLRKARYHQVTRGAA
jgi:AraC-like DNA-binding protein